MVYFWQADPPVVAPSRRPLLIGLRFWRKKNRGQNVRGGEAYSWPWGVERAGERARHKSAGLSLRNCRSRFAAALLPLG